MDRYICIHGHFYQPPRENPWLEAVELQDSAYPYHDWNERITAECYAPNAVARMLDGEGRIVRIVNNYAKISFNFGPTLLSWMEQNALEIYQRILEADKLSLERFGGHGSAIAQVYNHMILPLANRADKVTQVVWGLRDFEQRFGRKPEGMWLAETAVDVESLEVLAEHGIRYTVLAPHQAGKVRKIGEQDWTDVSNGSIDPTTAYVQRLPSGKTINLFFYDGPVARAVAFEKLLVRGEDLAGRLVSTFGNGRPQLVHIATDGETYGHHHLHGDMGLAYALDHIEKNNLARLTNYGEFLEKQPPSHEVEIIPNTSWSCAHGIERWRSNCGCNSGRAGWTQAWRGPLRAALDGIRDAAAPLYAREAAKLLKDPVAARNDYINVILNRSEIERFLAEHALRELSAEERIRTIKLLELQRQCLLMYTSCGWFFDEISGLETVQVLCYAGHAIQLADELFGEKLEPAFLDLLGKAPSNLPDHKNGRSVYIKYVKPAFVTWEEVAAHHAVSSLFGEHRDQTPIYSYVAESEDYQNLTAGKAKFLAGQAKVTSTITGESAKLIFGALHFGDHNVNGGVSKFTDERAYRVLVADLADAFQKADFSQVLRLFDKGFGQSTYSLKSLFRDEQRRVVKQILEPALTEAEGVYRKLFEENLPTMRFLADVGVPVPQAFLAATEYIVNTDLRGALNEDDPDLDELRKLLAEAKVWGVTLDKEGVAYRLKTMIGRLAERFRGQAADLALLTALEVAADLIHSLDFEVDLWQAQNAYYEMTQTIQPEFEKQAQVGDETAREWLERFLALGQKVGIQIGELKKKVTDLRQSPTVASVLDGILLRRRVPGATYRLQFNKQFTFQQAREIVPYLRELGISDLYASPILKARPGSSHGYDTVDPSQLNPELGGDEAFAAFSSTLKGQGMGLILDTVPNHMGIGASNPWWMDVLENGPSSIHADYFDIDWHPVNPSLENKLLLPVLGDQYGAVLERGELKLGYEDGAFFITYFEHRLPVAPASYARILERVLPALVEKVGEEDPHVSELKSILTAIGYLPPRIELPPEKIVERHREKEIIKKRIAALAGASPEFMAALEATLKTFNGAPGEPRSFDALDQLLEDQAYRPAFWRVASEEINYRRFFDINELAAIRVERPEVFQATHQLYFKLLADGTATGLRIDHPDGLWDPSRYFQQLQEHYLIQRTRALLGGEPNALAPGALENEVATRLDTLRLGAERPAWPLYVVAEKILGENEPLPNDWPVSGTTGYDFLNAVGGLFVDPSNREAYDAIYSTFIGRRLDFTHLILGSQKMIMLVSMASELSSLAHQLDRISERNRRYRDFTLASLNFAIREIIAALPVYRTYITGPEKVSLRDRRFVELAVEDAKDQNPRTAAAIFDFIRDTILLRNIDDFREEDRPRLIEWSMKFQQLTGPVLAKGMEDTSFYVYNRLASLNEVGGHPEHFGLPLEQFHGQNQQRRQLWPGSGLTTSTHDTKRSEDMRARLHVLSEIPQEWQAALDRWSKLNAEKKGIAEDRPAPDANDEYLLYQTLLGVWPSAPLTPQEFPVFRERIVQYMAKATKEAKVHTSWINPNEEYDKAVRNFVLALLPDQADDPFLNDLLTLQRRLAYFGHFNGLAQLLLKLTCPGVPDTYQGTELWDFSLVDPDNRRPVDYAKRRALLADLKQRSEPGKDLWPLARDLLSSICDGRIKLYLLYRVLTCRRAHERLFLEGSYVPLEAAGGKQQHVCAFLRQLGDEAVIVVAPRLVLQLCDGIEQQPLGDKVWGDTRIVLPEEQRGWSYRHLLTGDTLTAIVQEGKVGLPLAGVLGHFPVALLERVVARTERNHKPA